MMTNSVVSEYCFARVDISIILPRRVRREKKGAF